MNHGFLPPSHSPCRLSILCGELIVKLGDVLRHLSEDFGSGGRDLVRPAGVRRRLYRGGAEPAVGLHPVQEGIERSRADVVSVPPQLLQQVVPHHSLDGGVMEDVDLPEPEDELVEHCLLHIDIRKRLPQMTVVLAHTMSCDGERRMSRSLSWSYVTAP